MKCSTLLLVCLGGILHSVSAQEFDYTFSVREVKFGGTGSISIREDSTVLVYTKANWHQSGHREPAAYTSGNALSASAKFEISCAARPDSVWIRGFGSDTMNLPARVAKPVLDSGRYTFNYPLTAADKAFPSGIVNYYDPFRIKWEVSLDNCAHWTYIDETEHKLYVTKQAPVPENPYYLHFHTLLELSCKNAKGLSVDSDIIHACFEEFTDHEVLNYKGQTFTYYAYSMFGGASDLRQLFRQKDGVCYAYAQFFIALLKVQGIARTNNYINFYNDLCPDPCGYAGGIIVKNWDFGPKSDTLACPGFPYLYDLATELPGAPGVGTPNPVVSGFANHQLAKIDGMYYDACYGIKAKTMAEYKRLALEGFVVYDTARALNRFTKDLDKCDFTETVETY